MEKEFMMWLIDNQLIDIDTIVEKYIDEDENENTLHNEDYDIFIDNICNLVIGKYLEK